MKASGDTSERPIKSPRWGGVEAVHRLRASPRGTLFLEGESSRRSQAIKGEKEGGAKRASGS